MLRSICDCTSLVIAFFRDQHDSILNATFDRSIADFHPSDKLRAYLAHLLISEHQPFQHLPLQLFA